MTPDVASPDMPLREPDCDCEPPCPCPMCASLPVEAQHYCGWSPPESAGPDDQADRLAGVSSGLDLGAAGL